MTASIAEQVDLAGGELVRCDPGGDTAVLMECVGRMAVQNVDGWILLRTAELSAELCGTGPADVPMIIVGRLEKGCQQAGVGPDDRSSGVLVGVGLGNAASERFDCAPDAVMLVMDTQVSGAQERADGFRAGYSAACPGDPDDVTVLTADSQEQAFAAFTIAITGFPEDADLVVAAVSDDAALGVLAAVPEERTGSLVLAAVGGDERARCTFRSDSRWIGDAELFADRYGAVVIPQLLDAVHGQAIPEFTRVTSTFVDAETVNSFYPHDNCQNA